ncbi:MAG: IclR family transcriptional regulator [Robiginitomaculum sp.]|nr:MAG: IclR family transcriptional regulator [Robiginitomaculum sp.]
MVKPVPSVMNAFLILRHLARTNKPTGVNELARNLALNPSSCFNLVKTLVHEAMVEFDPLTKKYSLGSGFSELAMHAGGGRNITAIAAPLMNTLADTFNITAGLWRVDAGERMRLISSSESQAAARISMTIGQRLPLLAGANGRAFLMADNITETDIKTAYAEIRWQEDLPIKTYMKQVIQSKRQGFAIDNGSLFKGVTSLSVPIVNLDGETSFCLSTTLFTAQFSDELLAKLSPQLIAAGHSISVKYFGERIASC